VRLPEVFFIGDTQRILLVISAAQNFELDHEVAMKIARTYWTGTRRNLIVTICVCALIILLVVFRIVRHRGLSGPGRPVWKSLVVGNEQIVGTLTAFTYKRGEAGRIPITVAHTRTIQG
jgi:hypothetical protein